MFGTHRGVEGHRFSGVPVLWNQPVRSIELMEGLTYKFDSDLLVIQEIGALENHTKRSFTDFLAHTVVDTHHV